MRGFMGLFVANQMDDRPGRGSRPGLLERPHVVVLLCNRYLEDGFH